MENLINDMVESNKEVETSIMKKKSWDNLSKELKEKLGVKKNWHLCILKFSLKHQLRWKDSLVSSIVADERAYYEELVKKSTSNLLVKKQIFLLFNISKIVLFNSKNYKLYPYHLSDVLVRGLRLTPFKYYLEMMKTVMEADKSYDILPNFTAADAYRLLGVGRNQYINIVNESKIKVLKKQLKKKTRMFLQKFSHKKFSFSYFVAKISLAEEGDIRGTASHSSCRREDSALVECASWIRFRRRYKVL